MNNYKIVAKVLRVFSTTFYKFNVIGLENIPSEGKVILAANHKSNLDPVFLAAAIRSREVSVLAKQELFKIKPFAWFLNSIKAIPVDRENPSITTVKQCLKQLKDGEALGIFPEGTRCKDRQFGEAKAGLALFAIKGKSEIVPITILTTYKLFSKVTIYIDKPISLEQYYKEKLSTEDYKVISNEVMKVIEDNYIRLAK